MSERTGVLARCPLGGPAPCVDDLCYGGTTLCGLEPGFDFCGHWFVPETCPEHCDRDDDWDDQGFEDEE